MIDLLPHPSKRNVLQEFVAELAGCAVTSDTDLTALGLTSLELVELSLHLTDTLGRSITIDDIWRRKTIDQLIATAADAPNSEAGIAVSDKRPIRVASPQQQRFFAIHHSHNTKQTEVVATRVHFDRNVPAGQTLERLQQVFDQHDALRMRFVVKDNILIQVDQGAAQIPVEQLDWRGLNETVVNERIAELDFVENGRKYNIDDWPMFRCHLLHTDTGHIALFHAYHLVFDGNSREVLRAALVDGGQCVPGTAAERLSYSQFTELSHSSAWQAERSNAIKYWLELFKAPFAPFHLSTLHPAGDRADEVLIHRCAVPCVTYDDLRRCSAYFGSTPFMLLLAGFCDALLQDNPEITVAIPTHGRTDARVVNTIGLFQNSVFVRVMKSDVKDPRRLIEDVAGQVVLAQRHQAAQYHEIANLLHIPIEPHRHPITGVYFNNVHDLVATRAPDLPELYPTGARMKGDLFANYTVFEDRPIFSFRFRRGALTPERMGLLAARYFERIGALVHGAVC